MERNITTDAIVLTSRRWGELHRLATLLSPKLGNIRVVVYGGRKGKLASAVKPFTIGKFFLYYNNVRKDYSLKDVDITNFGEHISSNILNLYVALPMVEIAMRVEGGDWKNLYYLLLAHLQLFEDEKVDAKRIFIQYVWRLIELIGLQSDLSLCPVCLKNYSDDELLYFNNQMHTACCFNCCDNRSDSYVGILPPGARRYLRLTETLSLEQAMLIEISQVATERLFRYVITYITSILGSPLKSLNKSVLEN